MDGGRWKNKKLMDGGWKNKKLMDGGRWKNKKLMGGGRWKNKKLMGGAMEESIQRTKNVKRGCITKNESFVSFEQVYHVTNPRIVEHRTYIEDIVKIEMVSVTGCTE